MGPKTATIRLMDVASVLKSLQVLPKKEFGQNFLVDDEVLQAIVSTAELTSEDTVVEIGPGLGVLTTELTARAKRVIAIEADRDLAEYLRRKNIANLTVVTGDALQIDWTATIEGPYKIVANIPYSITSPLVRKIFSLSNRPTAVVLLMQKEVAERLTAEPGNNSRGYLTILIEAVAQTQIIASVGPESFYPAPTVNSAIVTLTPLTQTVTEHIFWPAVEAGFRHKRQMIRNSLFDLPISKEAVSRALTQSGVDPSSRPAMLSLDDWQRLSVAIQTEINA